jgi:hypothetical protein
MTCKRAPKASALSVVSLLITVFAILIALMAPAQLTGGGLPSPKPTGVPTSNGASPPLFLPAVVYDSGGSFPVSVAIADVNGDGKPDLLVANQGPGGTVSGTVSVLLGNGDGTFQAAVSYGSGGSFTYSLAVGDVNGDGKLDLVVTNAASNTVGVLLGHGDGTFAPALTFDSDGAFPDSVAIADVNGDGVPDIVVVDCGNKFAGCGGGQNGTAAVLLGNGDGTFRTGASYDAGSGPISVAIADVNGDGKPDIVVADCGANIFCPTSAPGAVSILLGNGDGTFQAAVSYSSGGISALSVAVADVNGDGKLDLLVANSGSSTVGVLLGNGDGTFQSAVAYSAGSIYSPAVVADVSGDGKLDLLVGNYPGSVAALLGSGDGTFQSPLAYSSGGSGPTSVAIGDVNGDGQPDVVVANFYSNSVGVLLNNTQADTTPPVITLSATPKVLWPPNGKMVLVTVSGTITDTGSGVNLNSAAYAVKDEYGEVQPAGAIALGPGGNYSFTVLLQASRLGSDLDGRRYTVTIRAQDNAGNRGSKTSAMTVPHDQGD